MGLLIALSILLGAPDSLRYRPEDIDALPAALVRTDRGRLIVELPAMEVPPHGTIRTPVHRVPIPFAVSLYEFAIEIVDDAGHLLPPDRLHHVVFTDPNRRELFLPLALPIFAASKESPRPRLPKHRVGLVLPASSRYLVGAMFHNVEAMPKRMVVRIVLSFIRPSRTVPLVQGYAWTLDVTYPLGHEGGRHDFDLPPGRSSFSWEASPQIAGTIIAMGGHAHDYADTGSACSMTIRRERRFRSAGWDRWPACSFPTRTRPGRGSIPAIPFIGRRSTIS